MRAIKELTAEAHEIRNNIRNCRELTYQQRNELMILVETDVVEKLRLAKGLLDAWKRDDMSGDMPLAG